MIWGVDVRRLTPHQLGACGLIYGVAEVPTYLQTTQCITQLNCHLLEHGHLEGPGSIWPHLDPLFRRELPILCNERLAPVCPADVRISDNPPSERMMLDRYIRLVPAPHANIRLPATGLRELGLQLRSRSASGCLGCTSLSAVKS